MNYKLELNTQEPNSKIVFNNILFDAFKVNVIERYTGDMRKNPILCEVLFKVRTLGDEIIEKRDGNVRVKIKGEDFEVYQRLARTFKSYEFKNKLMNRKDVEQEYVHFILSMVIVNYQLN